MSEATPTPGNGDASAADPLDRLESYLQAEGGEEAPQETAETSAEPTDEPAGDAQAQSAEPQLTTAQLAAVLGLDEADIEVDEDGEPVFKTKIDGKDGAVKFGDLRKTYQLQGHAENRAREAAQREQAAERKMQEADQAIQAKLQEQQSYVQNLGALAQVLQQELQGEYGAINWPELYRSDAGAARELEQRFQQRQARINTVLQNAAAHSQRVQQQAEQSRQANAEKAKEANIRRLYSLIPEWKDSATAAKEARDIQEWIETSGFDATDIDLNKASQVAMLRRAWMHDTLQKSKPATEKKLRLAPKLVKPGTPPQTDGKSAVLKTLKQQARGTGTQANRAIERWFMEKGLA
jgi:hypothetical protein